MGTNAPLLPRWERTDSSFDDWVADTAERADPFMAWLGLVFALLVSFDLAVEPGGAAGAAIEVVAWLIWGVFAVEFASRLWLAPHRLRYLRGHWWQVILLALPFLRFLSFLRLARAGRALPAGRIISSSYRATGTAKFLLRSRLGYLGALASLGTIAVAELVYIFERDAPGNAFAGFGDALLWAVTTTIALQADPVPGSVGGRLVMIVGLLIGLLVVASLAGVIGSFLVETRRERGAVEPNAGA